MVRGKVLGFFFYSMSVLLFFYVIVHLNNNNTASTLLLNTNVMCKLTICKTWTKKCQKLGNLTSILKHTSFKLNIQ